MSMLRHRGARAATSRRMCSLSARSEQDALYRDELEGLEPRAGLSVALDLHAQPARGLERLRAPRRRGDARRGRARRRAEAPLIFVCGPTPFVEAVADLLVDAGHDPRAIHAERFGPTGG